MVMSFMTNLIMEVCAKQLKTSNIAGFPIVGGGGGGVVVALPIVQVFEPPPPTKIDPPWGSPHPLKNEAPPSEKQTPH